MDVDEISNSSSTTTSKVVRCSKKMAFSQLERELIMALVRQRPIIEDKRIHARNIELKRQAWKDLTEDFNEKPYVSQRNHVQLKRCWENMKSQRKKELSEQPRSMKFSSGAPTQGVRRLEIKDIEAKKKQCERNIAHDQQLHELRVQREEALLERERNMIEYEKELHYLHKEKLTLEIQILKNKIS